MNSSCCLNCLSVIEFTYIRLQISIQILKFESNCYFQIINEPEDNRKYVFLIYSVLRE